MAKIFIIGPDSLKPLIETISNILRNNSGHRVSLFQEQSDLTLELFYDEFGGPKNPVVIIFDKDELTKSIGTFITEMFNDDKIFCDYPIMSHDYKEFKTIGFNVGRIRDGLDYNRFGNIISKAIIKYYNPEYLNIEVSDNSPKSSKNKTYYDRSFNSNSTSNSSILFKKKS